MSESLRERKIREFGLYIGQEDRQLNGLMNALASWLNVPMAFVSIVDDQTQFFKAKTGFEGDQIDPEPSFCNYVVNHDKRLLINDALTDALFKDNPYVVDAPHIRFYAGVPLRLDDVTVGTVCILDTEPHQLSERELQSLAYVSEHVSEYLALSLKHQQLMQEHSFIDDTPAALIKWRYNMALELQYVSANIQSLFHIPTDALREGSRAFEDFLDERGRKELNFLLSNHLAGVASSEAQFRILPPKGPERWVKLLSKSFYDPEGRLENIHAMLIDNTANRYFEKRLNEANQQMRLVLEASGLGTWDWNVPSDTNKVNQRWCELLGIDYANFDPSLYFWESLVHPADLKSVERELQQHMAGETPAFSTIYRMRHKNGYWVWIETYGRVVERSESGEAIRLTGTHRDITEKKEAELLDARGALFYAVQLDKARMDAETLMRHIRSDDMVARLGGEEFALILNGGTQAAAAAILEQIRQDIQQSVVRVDDHAINFTISIGALFIDNETAAYEDLEQAVLDHADKALYEAKKTGRNKIVWGE
ncbi:MAG: PAS/PAC and GAF sensor-containing diguanylate cyclase [Idiomarina sp. T82-3]|uniref:PAS domain-containing protein n=1 Tax=Idiomarina TaxID=135575 RepID=UPI000791D729|nr:PAS domain-containing protein [Idiomarina sp. T82-3]KXS35242.1 MAG: PAS/PAC and GAF sensor-containing diguanylate cyclase [Idiomarina sp. T82-3]